MKAKVLLASHDASFRAGLKDQVGGLCRLAVSKTATQTSTMLQSRPWDALVLDTHLPDFDVLELLHVLRHTPGGTLVITAGWPRLTTPLALTPGRQFITVERKIPIVCETLRGWLDPTSARTIREVRCLPKENAFFVAFRNGKTYELSRRKIEADDGSPVTDCRLEEGGHAFVVRQKSGNTYDVAWDFVLHHEEPDYPHYKKKMPEVDRPRRIGVRIRLARENRGWSLEDLARRTGMHRPNLYRLEAGKHLPSLETLERVAEALGLRVADLVAP